MGAGVRRWWRDDSKFRRACAIWEEQQLAVVECRIVHARPGELGPVRRLIEASAILWSEVKS